MLLTREIVPFLEAKHLNALTSPALLGLKRQRRGQAMRPINRTLEVLFREIYFSLSEKCVHDIPRCPGKETQISEIVGAPTLVTNRPRAGKSRSSDDFQRVHLP